MTPSHGVPPERFQTAYDDRPPWDIDEPQPDLVAIADQVRGAVLDVGCGTGENALFYAARGHDVWGIDIVPAAIEIARQKAARRRIEATFLVHDALRLSALGRHFDTVIDSGLFHVFSDADRVAFVNSLATVLAPGGRYHVLCFSERTPGTGGPRRVTQAELRDALSRGWTEVAIVPAMFRVRDDVPRTVPGAPQAWRATFERS